MKYELKTERVDANNTIDIPAGAICIQMADINGAARPGEYRVQWLEPVEPHVTFRGR